MTTVCDTVEQAVQAHETLSRVAVGLAMEHLTVSMSVGLVEVDEDGVIQ